MTDINFSIIFKPRYYDYNLQINRNYKNLHMVRVPKNKKSKIGKN